MKQYILYLNLPDSYCQIFLPTENNRKYELDLSAQLPIPACKMELELLDGHWWMLRNAQIYFSADGKGPDSMIVQQLKNLIHMNSPFLLNFLSVFILLQNMRHVINK